MNSASPETLPPRRRKNRRWIWFFVVLFLLCVVAGVTIVVSGFAQQLTRSELEAARARWKAKGPKSYELSYVVVIAGLPSEMRYVSVKGGVVIFASRNEMPLDGDNGKDYDVKAMFNDIERFLELRDQPGSGWTDVRAVFDKEDGHPLWYVRSVIGGRERVEVQRVKIEPR